MDYKIVSGRNVQDLQDKVSAEMRMGFVPQGGIHTVASFYAQAMVRARRSTSEEAE